MSAGKSGRHLIGANSCPTLAKHVRLQHDRVRGRWTVLAPERVFTPDDIAIVVLQLCDGTRSVETISTELAQTYNAPKQQILEDILAMLQDLADKGVVQG
jgi:pyrroloquinoline quinone biosynthesis protein D